MLPWPAWKKPRNPDWIREFFFYHGHYEFDPSSERTKFCMTGVTTEDHTILLELLGHDPYCYIKGPRSLHEAKDLINFWESRARATAHIYFGNKASWLLNRYLTKCRKWVIAVTEMKCEDLVEDRPWKRIENCYKVSFVHPALVKMLREYVLYCYGRESNPHIPQWAEKRNTEYNSWLLYEANVDYVERVIADRHFPPSSWFAISDKSTQTIILAEEQRMTYDRRAHRYDIWVNANITDITPIKDDRALYATRVLAYDIEAENEDGDHMPRAASNEVLSIAVIAYRDGQEKNAKSFAFELGSCESAVDHLFIFDNDEALLNAFRTFVMRSGCDALAGHNANGFDFPYLKERAKILELNQWDYQGPLQRPAKITATKNKGFSKHNLVIPGLLSVDTMRVEQETLGSRSLGLADLALRYLGDMSKMDVHPDELSRLQKSHEGRTKKHTYCVRDAVLVMRIEQAQKAIRASLNMSQLSVPIQTVLNRSQGAKGEGYIANVAAEAAMKTGIPKIMIVLSFMNRALRDRPQVNVRGSYTGAKEYEGAINLKPVPIYIAPRLGLTRQVIFTFDYVSLYPSIIRSRNISIDTIIRPDTIARMQYEEGKHYWASPDYEDVNGKRVVLPVPENPRFILPSIRRGLLPAVQDYLFEMRVAVKKKLAKIQEEQETAPSEDKKKIEKQLQIEEQTIKLLMNAIYGLMARIKASDTDSGQIHSMRYVSMEVASAITREGRGLILFARDVIHELFSAIAKVVGGDTDSIFVLAEVPQDDMQTYLIGKKMEEAINKNLTNPVHIGLESMAIAFSQFRRKNYAKLVQETKPGGGFKAPRIVVKGENWKKRNFPRNLKKACERVAEIIYAAEQTTNRYDMALKEIKAQIEKLTTWDVPIGDLQESSKLSKDLKEYKQKSLGKGPAMLKRKYEKELSNAKRPGDKKGDAKKRAASIYPPETGDIATYVIVPRSSEYPSPKVTERSVFGLDAIRKGVHYDREYYINQMMKTFAASFGQALATLSGKNEQIDETVTEFRRSIEKNTGKRKKNDIHRIERIRLMTKNTKEKYLDDYERTRRKAEFLTLLEKLIGNKTELGTPPSTTGIARYLKRVIVCTTCGQQGCDCDQESKKKELNKKVETLQKIKEEAWNKCAKCVQGVPQEAESCRSFRSCTNFAWRAHQDFKLKETRKEIADIEELCMKRIL